jgi:hypothetical protein
MMSGQVTDVLWCWPQPTGCGGSKPAQHSCRQGRHPDGDPESHDNIRAEEDHRAESGKDDPGGGEDEASSEETRSQGAFAENGRSDR